jgi:hypothetical protein
LPLVIDHVDVEGEMKREGKISRQNEENGFRFLDWTRKSSQP